VQLHSRVLYTVFFILICLTWVIDTVPAYYLTDIYIMNCESSIRLTSFNVNGLRNDIKRNAIFNKLRPLSHIVFLQETHSSKELENKWKTEWGSQIIFSHGISNSKGVAILFPKNLDYEIKDKTTDSEGRLLILKILLNEKHYNLCNIYAPTMDHRKEQIFFINTLRNKLATLDQENFILGGDLNIYLNPKLDKLDTMSNKYDHPEYRREFLSIMDSFSLADFWRILNPKTRRYTWHARGKASRLDYWLISEHFLNDINKCNIMPGVHSDHSIISVEIGRNFETRGKGFWKFNSSLLHDPHYVFEVKNIIKKSEQELNHNIDKGLIWEIVKLRIRSFSIPYCIRKKKEKKKFKNELEETLKELEASLDQLLDTEKLEIYKTTKKELENIENSEAAGHILRSKAKWTELGEKNSSFFLTLEKRNYLNKTISKLEENGQLITNEKDILNTEANYYQQLYSEKLNTNNDTYKKSLVTFIYNNNVKKISDSERILCDHDITEKEILSSLKSLHNGKTPGTDGFPSQFYKFFWIDIKTLLKNSILYAVGNGELSIEQRRGIITLIPKKNKNRLYLKNWRPLSLLNTDYKIITKILANRLKTVLPSIINHDQSGYLEGRFIGQNIRLIEDISFFTAAENKPGILLSIDFEKAFDSVNWNFLFKILSYLNFGNKIISYIKAVYNNIESTVINNGNTSKYFKLERGVRQGCPLSAYLFILVIETLANKIRDDPSIKGLVIDNKEIKISLLADDATCILADLKSLENILKLLKLFQHSSGLSINIDKTNAKYIGTLKNNDYFPHGLSWIKKPLETLGIIFTESEEQNYLYNFKPKLLTLQTKLNIWKQRGLSIKGKITVLNSLALSPLIYVSSVITTPTRVYKEVDNIIQDFIWNGGTSKLSKATLTQNINNGGLKMCNFQIKIKALQLSWIKRFTNLKDSTWKLLPQHFYKCSNLFIYFNANHELLHTNKIPSFYLDIHKEYMKHFKQTPNNITDILDQSLWLNKHITIQNKPIYWKHWQNKGIMTVSNILDHENKFLPYTELNRIYKLKSTYLQIEQIYGKKN